jgi:hypothetical protein
MARLDRFRSLTVQALIIAILAYGAILTA